jgi:hypothetical protein
MFTDYINENLSVQVSVKKWKGIELLSLFFKDHYDYYQCKILDVDCLLMIPKVEEGLTPVKIKKHFNQIFENHHLPGIYLASAITPFQRKRLIQQGIPFVIPGNQMYLPLLGQDLRDYYKKSRINQDKHFSPSTQAVLFGILYQKDQNEFTVSDLRKNLGYSSMTIVRAFDQLQSIGVAATRIEGR